MKKARVCEFGMIVQPKFWILNDGSEGVTKETNYMIDIDYTVPPGETEDAIPKVFYLDDIQELKDILEMLQEKGYEIDFGNLAELLIKLDPTFAHYLI